MRPPPTRVFDRRVQIQTPRTSQGPRGGPRTEWPGDSAHRITVFASVKPGAGYDALDGDRIIGANTYTVEMRYAPSVMRRMQGARLKVPEIGLLAVTSVASDPQGRGVITAYAEGLTDATATI